MLAALILGPTRGLPAFVRTTGTTRFCWRQAAAASVVPRRTVLRPATFAS